MRSRWVPGEWKESPSRPFVRETRTMPMARRLRVVVGILAVMTLLQQAPDFTLPDQDGNPVSMKGFRGQTVVVYFYAQAHARNQMT